MSFLVSALLALAAVGTVIGAAFYLGLISPGGGTATASGTPRPIVSFVPTTPQPSASPSLEAPSPTVEPSPTALVPGGTYTVQAGDLGLSVIGEKFGIPWQLIAQANNLQPPYTIHVGDVLTIPSAPVPSDGSDYYIVQSGDTIIGIADKLGVDWTDLADFNNIPGDNSIHAGDILYIPGPGWTPRPTGTPE